MQPLIDFLKTLVSVPATQILTLIGALPLVAGILGGFRVTIDLDPGGRIVGQLHEK